MDTNCNNILNIDMKILKMAELPKNGVWRLLVIFLTEVDFRFPTRIRLI